MLTVYLDSSDYSVFADPPAASAVACAEIFDRLRRYVDQGQIEVRYSAAHVSEICNTSPIHLPNAQRRAEVLDELCRGKCLRFADSIVEDEFKLRMKRRPWRASVGHAEGNEWFEVPIGNLRSIRDQFQKDITDEFKKRGVPRRQRSKGAMKQLVREFARSEVGSAQLKKAAEDLSTDFPIKASSQITDALRRFALGEVSDIELHKLFVRAMRDPLDLIAHLAPMIDANARLSLLVRNMGRDMAQAATAPFARVMALSIYSSRLGRTEDAKALLRKTFSDLKSTVKTKIVQKFVDEDANNDLRRWLNSLSPSEILKLDIPCTDVFVAAMTRKLWDIASNLLIAPNSPMWTPQDGVDLMHARNAPYVDIFRCDGGWYAPVSASAKKYGTTVVGKLSHLCTAIDSKLAATSAS